MLRILLFVLAGLEGVLGLALLFATGSVMGLLPGTLGQPATPFIVLLLKGVGVVALVFGYLFCVAARDPVRYVAVIDALIVLLLASAALTLYGLTALGIGAFYPAAYLVVRALAQIAIAAVLFALRPKVRAVAR
jgi:hypothetical protein